MTSKIYHATKSHPQNSKRLFQKIIGDLSGGAVSSSIFVANFQLKHYIACGLYFEQNVSVGITK
jgi:hypothetical protein